MLDGCSSELFQLIYLMKINNIYLMPFFISLSASLPSFSVLRANQLMEYIIKIVKSTKESSVIFN